MSNCIKCGKSLTSDEIGIYKKLIHRGAKEFMCKNCLAKKIDCTEEMINQKIEFYRAGGCTLFQPKK